MSTNLKIAKASLILITASILGHLLSLGKEIIVAAKFGITRGMDAFYAAISVPNLINSVLLSALGAVFIPVFIRYKLKDKEEANRVASVVMNYFFIFFISGAVIIFILAPWIIKYGFHGFDLETSTLAINILRIASFTLIFSGLIGIMTGILNAHHHFTWPAFSQMFVTLSTIFFILLFMRQWGIFVLVWGLLFGLIIQFFFLIPITKQKEYHYYPDFNWKHPAVKEMLKLGGVYFVAIVMAECNLVVDKVMASYLAPGSIAALGYAGKLVNVPLIIFSSSIATAVFPFFSQQVAEGKVEEMKDSLSKSIRMSGFIFIPLTVMLIILAKPIIQLLFQRGAFTSKATDLTSLIFICYSFQFFFYTVGIIMSKVFLALQDIKTLFKITVIAVIMNIILNLVFIKIISPPAAGIALSTSCIYFIAMFMYYIILKRKIADLCERYILTGFVKIGISCVFMGSVVFLMLKIYGKLDTCTLFIYQVVRLGIIGLLGVIVFIGCAAFFRIEELNKLKEIIYDRIK
ncbi:MAG: murein biosynthesis integral membrane protein MurJ [bacterium]